MLLIKEEWIEEHGKIDFNAILAEWKKWLKEEFAPKIVKRINENKEKEE